MGLALRLCIKLRYHRKTASSPDAQVLDPYTVELQKRFFWCAYCFDRFVSQIFIHTRALAIMDRFNNHRLLAILSKLPFGISDADIDVEVCCPLSDPHAGC